jgi:hypothetical protein
MRLYEYFRPVRLFAVCSLARNVELAFWLINIGQCDQDIFEDASVYLVYPTLEYFNSFFQNLKVIKL